MHFSTSIPLAFLWHSFLHKKPPLLGWFFVWFCYVTLDLAALLAIPAPSVAVGVDAFACF